MGKFTMILPDDVINDIQKINDNADEIFGGMTRKAAEKVHNNVMANMPASLKSSGFASNVFVSRTYQAPSYGGVATKVMISGYFTNSKGKKTPAPLVANMFEYGTSKREYPKQPFFWRSFSSSEIENIMKKAQLELSGGLLKDE